MASLRSLVQWHKEDLLSMCEWIAFYKKGRSWASTCLYVEDVDYQNSTIYAYDVQAENIKEIIDADQFACIVNPYYINIPCSYDERWDIQLVSDRIKACYIGGWCQLRDWIIRRPEEKES